MSSNRMDITNNNDGEIDPKLLYVSASKYESDWNSTLHSHAFSEIFYVTKGVGSFIVDNKKFNVCENDMVIVNPNAMHTEKSLDLNPLEYVAIGVDGIGFDFGKDSTSNQFIIANFSRYKTEFSVFFDILIKEIENKQAYNEQVCKNIFEVMLIALLRRFNFEINIMPHKNCSREIEMAKNYIDANFKENITLEEIAGVSHLNKYYLVHSFKIAYEIPPINYLIKKRIDESMHLLATTNNSIAMISDIVGFSSQSYFSQAFKKSIGMSPFEYRKNQTKF